MHAALETPNANALDKAAMKAGFVAQQAAYAAWAAAEERQPSPPLDETLTNDQLWWIAAAQQYCVAGPEEVQRPAKAAVRGNAALSPAFAKAFSCPIGKPMNPDVLCKADY